MKDLKLGRITQAKQDGVKSKILHLDLKIIVTKYKIKDLKKKKIKNKPKAIRSKLVGNLANVVNSGAFLCLWMKLMMRKSHESLKGKRVEKKEESKSREDLPHVV